MSGISIPIGADLSELQAAFAGLSKDIRALTGAITAAFAPATAAARQAAAATDGVGTSARRSQATWISWGRSVSEVVASIGNIASAIPHLGKLNRSAQLVGTGLRGMIASARFQRLQQGAQSAAAALRRMVASPNFKKIALGAAAAAVAVGTVVVATRAATAGLRRLGRVGGGVFRALREGAASVRHAVAGIFTGGGPMGGALRLAGAAGVLALAVSQIRGALGAAMGFEDLQVQMEQFTGSAEKAKALMAELTDFSTRTPFETRDILEAAKALQSAGIQENISGITKELAAVSSNGQQLKELADALAKGSARGKFQTEELNKFIERGINLLPELSTQTGLSGEALRKAIEAGLGFETVTAAIRAMSQEGGQFYGLLERRSRTTTGLVSTLKSAWDELRRTFAQPLLDAIKPILTGAIEQLNELRVRAQALGETLRDAFLGAFVLIRDGKAMEVFSAGFKVAISGAMDLLMRGFRAAVAFLAATVPPVMEMATAKLHDQGFWEGVQLMFQGLGQTIAAGIQDALWQKDKAEQARGGAETSFQLGGNLIRGAGNGEAVGEALARSVQAGLSAAAEAAAEAGPTSAAFQSAQSEWKELMESVSEGVAKLRRESEVPPVSPGATGASTGKKAGEFIGPEARKKEEAAEAGSVAPAVSSLARLGGGGGGFLAPMVRAQNRTNHLLEKVVVKMDRGGAGVALAG